MVTVPVHVTARCMGLTEARWHGKFMLPAPSSPSHGRPRRDQLPTPTARALRNGPLSSSVSFTRSRSHANPGRQTEIGPDDGIRVVPARPGNPQFPFPRRFPISPGNGEGIPDSRLGRNREAGNPRFPMNSAGNGNRGPDSAGRHARRRARPFKKGRAAGDRRFPGPVTIDVSAARSGCTARTRARPASGLSIGVRLRGWRLLVSPRTSKYTHSPGPPGVTGPGCTGCTEVRVF
jgi:hypothetical protein